MNSEAGQQSRAGASQRFARSVGTPGNPNPHVPVDCSDFMRIPVQRKIKFIQHWDDGKKSKVSIRRLSERWVRLKLTDLHGVKNTVELDLVARTGQLTQGDESFDLGWAASCTRLAVDQCREHLRHEEARC